MSTTLHARGLSASHGERTLFADLDLTLAPGDVIGLVGVNGAGKSTLLRMLADRHAPTGSITLSPPDATVGYLAQEPERVPGETVLAFLGRRTGVTVAQQTMDVAAERLTEGGADEYSPRWSAGWHSAVRTSTSAPTRWRPISAWPTACRTASTRR